MTTSRSSVIRLLTSLMMLSVACALAYGCGGSEIDGGSADADAGSLRDVEFTPDTATPDVVHPDAKPTPDVRDTATPSDIVVDASLDVSDTLAEVRDTSEPDVQDTSPDIYTHPCPEILPTMEEALRLLEAGLPQQALALYREAEEACPESERARFGAALSEMIDALEFFLSVLSLVSQADSMLFIDAEQTYDEWIGSQISWLFDELTARFRASLDRLETLRESDLEFQVEHVPIYNVTRPFLVLRGSLDQGDVHIMRLVAQNVIFLADIIRTQDMESGLLSLYNRRGELEDSAPGMAGVAMVALGQLMHESPEFLSAREGAGEDAFREAQTLLAAMAGTLDDALAWMAADGREGDGQVSGLRPIEGQPGSLIFSSGVRFDADGERIYTQIRLGLPQELLDALGALSSGAVEPGRLVSWRDGPAWLLGAWLSVTMKTGLIEELSFSDITIPTGNAGIRDLSNLFSNLLPFPLAFDLGTMFQTPNGLQSFLPRPTSAGDGLLVEWECPGELSDGWPNGTGSILCDDADGLEDGPHFVGTPDEIAADGEPTAFPYFAFRDPTMSGLVYIDMDRLGIDADQTFIPADQSTLNRALAAGLAPILNLLSAAP